MLDLKWKQLPCQIFLNHENKIQEFMTIGLHAVGTARQLDSILVPTGLTFYVGQGALRYQTPARGLNDTVYMSMCHNYYRCY